MSGWLNTDAHTSAPLFALAQVNKAPTAANMGAAGSGKLFNNATEDNLINGITIGLFNLNFVLPFSTKLYLQSCF